MNTAFNLAKVKRDGELLIAERANALIEAANRLATMQVRTVRTAGMPKSGLLISKENAVLALAYRDAANVLGTAATVDIVIPNRRSNRTANGRNGSGGTIITNSDNTISVISTTASGGIGSVKAATGAFVKVDGQQKTITDFYVMIGNAYVQFGFSGGASCYITLPTVLMNGTDTPYASQALAQAALTDYVAGCMVQQNPPASGEQVDLFTASFASSVLSIARTHSVTTNPEVGAGAVLFSCNVTALGGLQIDYTLNANVAPHIMGLAVQVYAVADVVTPVDTDSDTQLDVASISGTFNLTVPSDGVYYVFMSYGIYSSGGSPVTSLAYTGDHSSGGALSICAARAAWDNGGTTEYVYC